MNWIHKIRYAIILAGICAFAVSVYATHPSTEAKDPEPEREEFWPPDMVPHPGPPHSPPKKDEMS